MAVEDRIHVGTEFVNGKMQHAFRGGFANSFGINGLLVEIDIPNADEVVRRQSSVKGELGTGDDKRIGSRFEPIAEVSSERNPWFLISR